MSDARRISHVRRFAAAAMLACLLPVVVPGCDLVSKPSAAPDSAVAATPVRTENWARNGGVGYKLLTDHYTVFTTLGPSSTRDGLNGFLEAARANYVKLTGLSGSQKSAASAATADKRLVVYLFASRDEWATLTQQITGGASDTYLKVQRGGYCYGGTCVFWDIGPSTYSVAAHEGLHQFLYHALKQTLPIWAEEGLAVQCEGYQMRDGLVSFNARDNGSRMMTLRQVMLQDRWRPVDRLIAMSATDNVQENALYGADYYSQLWALLLLIRQDPQYSAGLARMMNDAAAGRLGEELGIDAQAWARLQHNAQAYTAVVGPKAFAHYIEPNSAAFEARFRAFAAELARL
jgi:hypothetical protein